MADLPFVDVHQVTVRATREAVWAALIGEFTGNSGQAIAARLLGCDPATSSPDFAGRPGQTVPGFRVVESEPGRRLVFAGEHRFSRYRLTFVFEDDRDALRAETHAAFPGVLGRLYRAAVISSGGHVFATRRMLRGIAARAHQPTSAD